MRVRAEQGDSVDALCYRHYGSTTGMVEAVYLANPGLCELGPVLPTGHPVEMPAPVRGAAGTANIIQLWD